MFTTALLHIVVLQDNSWKCSYCTEHVGKISGRDDWDKTYLVIQD